MEEQREIAIKYLTDNGVPLGYALDILDEAIEIWNPSDEVWYVEVAG